MYVFHEVTLALVQLSVIVRQPSAVDSCKCKVQNGSATAICKLDSVYQALNTFIRLCQNGMCQYTCRFVRSGKWRICQNRLGECTHPVGLDMAMKLCTCLEHSKTARASADCTHPVGLLKRGKLYTCLEHSKPLGPSAEKPRLHPAHRFGSDKQLPLYIASASGTPHR